MGLYSRKVSTASTGYQPSHHATTTMTLPTIPRTLPTPSPSWPWPGRTVGVPGQVAVLALPELSAVAVVAPVRGRAGGAVPAGVGLAVVVLELAQRARQAHRADAAEAVDQVHALAAPQAGRRLAVVDVSGAVATWRYKAHRYNAHIWYIGTLVELRRSCTLE